MDSVAQLREKIERDIASGACTPSSTAVIASYFEQIAAQTENTEDLRSAIKWHKKSLALGHGYANFRLGRDYTALCSETGSMDDIDNAIKYLKASKNDNLDSDDIDEVNEMLKELYRFKESHNVAKASKSPWWLVFGVLFIISFFCSFYFPCLILGVVFLFIYFKK